MNKRKNNIVFIKAGNALRDFIDTANDNSQYHYHLSEIMSSLNNNFFKYIYCFGDSSSSKTMDTYKFVTVNKSAKCNLFKPFKRIFLLYRLLIFLIKTSPRFIVSNSANEFILGAFIYKFFFGCTLVSSSHGALDNKSNKIFRMLNIFILNRVDYLIIHGPYLRKSLIKKIDKSQVDKILVYDIPCIDLHNLRENIDQHHLKENGQRIITYNGRLEESKGAMDLFNAFLSITKEHDDVRLIYAGKGSCYELLESLIYQHKLSKKIFLLGRIGRKEMASLLGISDIVVAATRKHLSEGRCQSVIEALSLGVPVIAPNYGAFHFTLTDGVNGLFFEADNIKNLTSKIKIALRDNAKLKEGAVKLKNNFINPPLLNYSEAINFSVTGKKN